ncbi:MAG: type secretion system stator protein SctL [Pseudomonadota bacterium]|jgi:type III secretion protein L|uniref:Type 3 secretion system stator protein n=1 Tax=Thiothrix fructosivorans TaxID=111770 RepID=A0A8B0SD32_9GAMM|nr:type III secretion system stator protein SctL [Thiothrix fructosivorans]MBO0614414.1 type III secretion system stator protein SctL [Thiothrix fructosivorans]QTX09256.1 type III secretion system stator protein SctL [Thiothrix fructosivorans]
MAKFFSIKPVDAQLRAGQKVLKAEDYEQLVAYDHMATELQNRHRQREEIVSVALGRSIKRGLEQGRERANQEAAEMMTLFTGRVNDTLMVLEGELVELVITAVRKVIYSFDQEERVRNAVQAGLELVRGSHKLMVRVHPNMQAAIAAQLDAIPHRFTSLEVVGDDQVFADGCILESDLGIVNAGLDQQLQVIEQALRGTFVRPGL